MSCLALSCCGVCFSPSAGQIRMRMRCFRLCVPLWCVFSVKLKFYHRGYKKCGCLWICICFAQRHKMQNSSSKKNKQRSIDVDIWRCRHHHHHRTHPQLHIHTLCPNVLQSRMSFLAARFCPFSPFSPPPLDSILSVAIFSHFHITLPFVCRRLFRCFIYYCSVTSSQMHNETNTLQPKTKK